MNQQAEILFNRRFIARLTVWHLASAYRSLRFAAQVLILRFGPNDVVLVDKHDAPFAFFRHHVNHDQKRCGTFGEQVGNSLFIGKVNLAVDGRTV